MILEPVQDPQNTAEPLHLAAVSSLFSAVTLPFEYSFLICSVSVSASQFPSSKHPNTFKQLSAFGGTAMG